MPVSTPARKRLWAASGNCCARCKIALSSGSDGINSDLAIVGEECHIVARSPEGPRPASRERMTAAEIDAFANLILLCPTCHQMIDAREDAFPPDVLRLLKQTHEEWVRTQTSTDPRFGDNPTDIQALGEFYICFDRYAFREAMANEEHVSFIQAMRDTRVAMATGVIRQSDGLVVKRTRPKSDICNPRIRAALDEVVDLLRRIELRWDEALRNGEIVMRGSGCVVYSRQFQNFADDTRNAVLSILNPLFSEAGRTTLPLIPSVTKRRRGYAPGPLAIEGEPRYVPDASRPQHDLLAMLIGSGTDLFGRTRRRTEK